MTGVIVPKRVYPLTTPDIFGHCVYPEVHATTFNILSFIQKESVDI